MITSGDCREEQRRSRFDPSRAQRQADQQAPLPRTVLVAKDVDGRGMDVRQMRATSKLTRHDACV